MLRCRALDFGGSWSEHLPLVEFSYNNSYQASIGMAPYEALYGRPCRSPLCWAEAEERLALGQTTDKVRIIRDCLRVAQSRQKSFSNTRRLLLEFTVGDFVVLKVTPKCGVSRSGIK